MVLRFVLAASLTACSAAVTDAPGDGGRGDTLAGGDSIGDPGATGDPGGDPGGDPSGDPVGDPEYGDPGAGDPFTGDAQGDPGDLPPVGQTDLYETFLESPIQVPAPGVLANDSSDSLSAELVSDASHGALTLRSDGSFDYVPDAGFVGDDSFSYAPSDGVAGEPVTVTLTVQPPALDPTLVILVFHPENVQARPTAAEIQSRMDTVRDYYLEYSYNRRQLTGVLDPDHGADVVGWYQSESAACFDQSEFFTLADTDADFTVYRRFIFVLAQRSGCTLSAWATYGADSVSTPDGSVWASRVRMSLPNAQPGTLTHEIGHTLNNGHASFLDCGDVSWAADGCTTVTYGDPYDVMSLGIGHFAARRKRIMGWLDPISNRMELVSSSGVYVVEALESNTGGIKGLEIARDLDYPLHVEYRQPIGTDASFGAGADVYEGALLHIGTELIDTTPPPAPYGPLPPTDAELTPTLHVGESWVDPLTGITVTVVSSTGADITVDVALD